MRRTDSPPLSSPDDLIAASTANQAPATRVGAQAQHPDPNAAIRTLVRELARLAARSAWQAAGDARPCPDQEHTQ